MIRSRALTKFNKGDLVKLSGWDEDPNAFGIVLGPGMIDKSYDVFIQGHNVKQWFFPVNMRLIRAAKSHD